MCSVLATTFTSSFAFDLTRLQSRKTNLVTRFASTKFEFEPIRASCSQIDRSDGISRIVKKTAGVVVLTAVTTAMIGRFGQLPAMAKTPTTSVKTVGEENPVESQSAEVVGDKKDEVLSSAAGDVTQLAELLQENKEAVEVLKALLHNKLLNGEDELALKILNQLVEAQPKEAEWRYLRARMLNEMDLTEEARKAFEEILKSDPLNYEALFENALLMMRCGESAGVIRRLEEALRIANKKGKRKEARDVRLIIAQMKFLQNDVDEALNCYDELIREDPNDFRTHFTKGMIYTMINRIDDAKEEFTKYKKLSPKKSELQNFLKTPLSRMLVYGTSDPHQI
uniref:Protein prenylyltransferase superfamily protein n=1 Tax=Sedum alfredii TaxID=439688 RepID=A0A8E4V0F8_9MAGN|nr:protein prenylyltransferase superfamily protein [Sedum alfredii]